MTVKGSFADIPCRSGHVCSNVANGQSRFRVHALEGLGFSVPSFDELCRQHPDIAIKLLQALGRELSVRIRHANMTIQQLET